MDRCGVVIESEPAIQQAVSVPLMDEQRRVLYIPSSPVSSDKE